MTMSNQILMMTCRMMKPLKTSKTGSSTNVQLCFTNNSTRNLPALSASSRRNVTENRVLNKRAALLHKQLNKKFASTFSQLTQKCNRKQVAQKFHSILVLQKMMALDINQEMEP